MTRAEAIKYAEDKAVKLQLNMDRPESMYGDYAIYLTELEFISAALHALSSQADTLPDGPLTLDELREMDGEPVWVVQPGLKSRWHLVACFKKIKNNIYLWPAHGSELYAETALANGARVYRRKPEERES